MEKRILEIKEKIEKIKIEKKLMIEKQNYLKASMLHEREKFLLSELKNSKK